MDESVAGFAALDAPAFGLRVGWLVPAGGDPSTIDSNLKRGSPLSGDPLYGVALASP